MNKNFTHKFLYKVDLSEFLLFRILTTMPVSINKIDQAANRTPHPETLPRHAGKIIHDVCAAQNGKRAHNVDCRAAERPLGLWILMPHHHNSY